MDDACGVGGEQGTTALGRASLPPDPERGRPTGAVDRRHGVNPKAYLTQLLANLPDTPVGDIDQWLPDEWKRRVVDQPLESNES